MSIRYSLLFFLAFAFISCGGRTIGDYSNGVSEGDTTEDTSEDAQSDNAPDGEPLDHPVRDPLDSASGGSDGVGGTGGDGMGGQDDAGQDATLDCKVGSPGTHATIEGAVADPLCVDIYLPAIEFLLQETLSLRVGQSLWGTIDGSTRTNIRGDGTFGILAVPQGSFTTLSRLALVNGAAEQGAGIHSEGNLRLIDVHVVLGNGVRGVGIHQVGGSLSLNEKSYIQANSGRVTPSFTGPLKGIGIYGERTSLELKTGSQVSACSGYVSAGDAQGAGIYLDESKILIDKDSNVSSNLWIRFEPSSPQVMEGGGIYIQGQSSSVSILGGIKGNKIVLDGADLGLTTLANGAGLSLNNLPSASLEGAQVLGNEIRQNGGENATVLQARGGGVFLQDTKLAIKESNLTGNGIILNSQGIEPFAQGGALALFSSTPLALSSNVTIVDTVFSSNRINIVIDSTSDGTVQAEGGALYLSTCTKFTSISGSTFLGNNILVHLKNNLNQAVKAVALGGAIRSGGGPNICPLFIKNSQFTSDGVGIQGESTPLAEAHSAGGAVYFEQSEGDVRLNISQSGFLANRSTVSGSLNAAYAEGGALAFLSDSTNAEAALHITNSSFSHQLVDAAPVATDAQAMARGGAVFVEQNSNQTPISQVLKFNLAFNTFVENLANPSDVLSAAISISAGGTSTANFQGNLLIDAVRGQNLSDVKCAGTFTLTAKNNRVGTTPTCSNFSASQLGHSAASLGLGPVVSMGNETTYHAPNADSSLINAAPSEECLDAAGALLLVDQKDKQRTGGSCDLGAFER